MCYNIDNNLKKYEVFQKDRGELVTNSTINKKFEDNSIIYC